MDKLKTLYIVRGLPGSGKSTLARKLTEFVCEADDFFMVRGEYVFDADKLGEAHAQCFERVGCYLASGKPVVAVANTFTRKWEYEKYIELAEKHGYSVHVLTCENNFGSTHNVPERAILQMDHRWERRSTREET